MRNFIEEILLGLKEIAHLLQDIVNIVQNYVLFLIKNKYMWCMFVWTIALIFAIGGLL